MVTRLCGCSLGMIAIRSLLDASFGGRKISISEYRATTRSTIRGRWAGVAVDASDCDPDTGELEKGGTCLKH